VPLTPTQRRRRAQFERVIGLAAPALDAVLWVGDKFSRVVDRGDASYDPPRPPAPDSLVRASARLGPR
jgi:hypothetical protein